MGNFHSKPYYDDWVKLASPEIKEFLQAENKFIQKILSRNCQKCSVLDIGCGYGRTIDFIHKIPLKIVGIDNNKRMVQNARRNLKKYKNVKVMLMDASGPKFREKFDFVLCLANTFGNFSSDKIKALEGMKRVLKCSGKIIIHVYNQKSLKFRLKDYKKAGMPILKIDKAGTVYSADGLKLEQFSAKRLREIFSKAKLDVKIGQLTPISYICVATKRAVD
ncbi:class I SAM-dependent methyltransferase [Patescibacteria group bacterium]|nr:class I SAM-dependent methyltransferase [Patescibacteria group bacterium]MBU1921843.1 class I SAM-dependent methyltransferase [Patescibacteria group bacterium]